MAGRWIVCAALGLAVSGCDRRTEPVVEGEEPRQPDLSRIFPPGAEQSASQAAAEVFELPAPPTGRGAPPLAGSAEPIRGTVSVAPELADRVTGGGVLFIIARPGAAGPPLAVKRIPSPELPLEFAIGPKDRMIQSMPFVGPLQVTARLDTDGNATTRTPGDLQSTATLVVQPGDQGIEVLLDEAL